MSVCSYFWDSQQHLSTAAFWIELGGAIVEVIVSIVIVATFNKEWEEKVKKRLEYQFEIGFLIAAAIAVVAIVSNRRLETLREFDEKLAKQKSDVALGAAIKAAQIATNIVNNANVAVLQNLPRHLSNDQKNQLLRAVLPLPKEQYSFFFDQNVRDARGLAQDMGVVFEYAGWKLLPPMGGMAIGLGDGILVEGDEKRGGSVKAIADILTSFGLYGHAFTNQGRWTFFSNSDTIIVSNVISITIGNVPVH
jgi:hypothetical protein